MQVIGTVVIPNPFPDQGPLLLNGTDPGPLRGKTPASVVTKINTKTSVDGVTASLTTDGHLQLDSANNFTIGGDAQTLSDLGLTATP